MALSKAFEAFAAELFAGLGDIRLKRMFGGAALYKDERIFALLDDEAVWIKVDALNEPAFLEAGSPKLSYPTKDGVRQEMSYRQMPQGALDDPEEACRWARLGIEAAARKPAPKPRRKTA